MTATRPRVPLPPGLAEGIAKLNSVTMDGDFDAARRWLAQLRELSESPDLTSLTKTMDALRDFLGPLGTTPSGGLGRALVDVNEALGRLARALT